MNADKFDMGNIDIAWCPGCGNFSILDVLKDSLAELEISPEQLVMVSGIGQAAKIPHYLKANFFNGLHGRALSPATAIKVSSPSLTVIAESGDGDMYGEGGNHFIHTIRRNPNITNIVHDNMVYGLTKGQASPTSRPGFKTGVQINGVVLEPFNPLAVAIGLDAGFAARTSITDKELTKDIIKQAVRHNGYALVDLLQPCPSFNKVNNYKWFKENTYRLEDTHDPSERDRAFSLACKTDKLALGVFYKSQKPSFEENISAGPEPLHEKRLDTDKLESLIKSFAS
ncbi:2-oxoglutarate oxidoreductase subunit KorB [Sedimentisphaera cyanobacteriorum]|uniref:2-oxoglutarate oxidoreductase subunit KorB n=1 Tax=Sedimentisphaera cyanobacteriorum TaxID=1940790 RepID=A0A1Q2HRN0_9BACT|nr:thiamine pyrophosphate-dependent enzyme [Sedimentisphaera cyanobacteriorum]AQQ09991.1 2-oxoglutarate oxidoreductase subunit KorB [Sedimentisphaera cyanobacteriorum]